MNKRYLVITTNRRLAMCPPNAEEAAVNRFLFNQGALATRIIEAVGIRAGATTILKIG